MVSRQSRLYREMRGGRYDILSQVPLYRDTPSCILLMRVQTLAFKSSRPFPYVTILLLSPLLLVRRQPRNAPPSGNTNERPLNTLRFNPITHLREVHGDPKVP
jgi:hypothetical protein